MLFLPSASNINSGKEARWEWLNSMNWSIVGWMWPLRTDQVMWKNIWLLPISSTNVFSKYSLMKSRLFCTIPSKIFWLTFCPSWMNRSRSFWHRNASYYNLSKIISIKTLKTIKKRKENVTKISFITLEKLCYQFGNNKKF
jgi:DNA-binding Xre family transcriptional regulator